MTCKWFKHFCCYIIQYISLLAYPRCSILCSLFLCPICSTHVPPEPCSLAMDSLLSLTSSLTSKRSIAEARALTCGSQVLLRPRLWATLGRVGLCCGSINTLLCVSRRRWPSSISNNPTLTVFSHVRQKSAVPPFAPSLSDATGTVPQTLLRTVIRWTIIWYTTAIMWRWFRIKCGHPLLTFLRQFMNSLNQRVSVQEDCFCLCRLHMFLGTGTHWSLSTIVCPLPP